MTLEQVMTEPRRRLTWLFDSPPCSAVYEVVTATGDVRGAGTDANVFVTLFGESGISPKLHLSSKSKDAFERCKTDIFRLKTNNIGPLKKIRIEHDNTGASASWYLERVTVTDVNRPHLRYYFPCGQWLSRVEGDGLIVRDLMGSLDPTDVPRPNKYVVRVKTGDVKGGGTDADVFINIFGDLGDTGERRLDNEKDNFERGVEDKFTIESPALGIVKKLSIGHNNKGSSSGWFLEKVTVEDIDNDETYDFPVNRWFAVDEDDGKIQRDIIVGGTEATGIIYNISITTGDVRGAGTNSKVYIILHGAQGLKNSGRLFLPGGQFERSRTDCFSSEVAALLSPLSRVTIGHDNSGVSSGWFCDKVVVYCPFTGIEQSFPCRMWLDEDEGDGLIERELHEMISLRQIKQKKLPWSLWIWTSDVKGAGTDARVCLQVYGEHGKSDEIQLDNNSDNFESGLTDKFMIELPDIGFLFKIRIWHDSRAPFGGWHLQKVTLLKYFTKEKYSFMCGRWLDANEEDGFTVRELSSEGEMVEEPQPVVKYLVTIHTGKHGGGGTDANVFVCLYGEQGDTGDRMLYTSRNNVNKFERGNVDEFVIECVTLKRVTRVRIGHDGRGGSSGWFLDKIMVKEMDAVNAEEVEFPCNRWLDDDEDDGQIVRELVPLGDAQMLKNVSYHIHIKTGDMRGANTDSHVFLKLHGSRGDTGRLPLKVSDNGLGDKFSRNRVDVFTVQTADVGKINRILIGHDNSGLRSGWFLDSVVLDVPVSGLRYRFAAHRWLSKKEADGKTEAEIYPTEVEHIEKCINYQVSVHTGNVRSAGTNANVFIQLYGDMGKTEVHNLRNRSDNFERASNDIFKVEAMDVGKVVKLRVGHDNSGMGSGWFLDSVVIRRLRQSPPHRPQPVDAEEDEDEEDDKEAEDEDSEEVQTYTFPCKRWLARDEDDGEIVRELLPQDGAEMEEKVYTVCVCTGDVMGAGTDANVFVNVYGHLGDTGERRLRKAERSLNKFERGQRDIFKLKAIDLGELTKLRIRHDNCGGSAAWFLDRVEITDENSKSKYFFPCQRWLAIDEDDGQLARELVPVDEVFLNRDTTGGGSAKGASGSATTLGLEQKAKSTTYNIRIKTGDKRNAGSDANVFAILYGERDDTGVVSLKTSKCHRNKFERRNVDEFTLEAVGLGELRKICVGHDAGVAGSGWFLDWVEIDAPSLGQKMQFPCGRWLDRGEDDGAIERVLYPNCLQTLHYTPFVPYEITVFTSDIRNAGTNADVSLVLYGPNGVSTRSQSLCRSKRERHMYFERGANDVFVLELEDVGETIEKLRVGHNNVGINSGWHLDRVEVRRLLPDGKGSETVTFPCDRWLARSEEDGETLRELVPCDVQLEQLLEDGTLSRDEYTFEDPLDLRTYKVSVHTSDVRGAGTDANVFLTIYGDLGDTGERRLSKSETNTNKFERGQVDRFTLEAVDLGTICKIRVRHDNSMLHAGWLLDRVEVYDAEDGAEDSIVFHCERWLSREREDGLIERVLFAKGYAGSRNDADGLGDDDSESHESDRSEEEEETSCKRHARSSAGKTWDPSMIPYHVAVTTGPNRDNGTSSRGYVIMRGARKQRTRRLWLDSTDGRLGFAPDRAQSYRLVGRDVGMLRSVELGHDGVTPESCWFVEEFSLLVPTRGLRYVFQCRCWLAKDRGDGLTARVFSVLDAECISLTPKVLYEVAVETADESGAGTDAQLFLTVFGVLGSTEEMSLDKNGDRFERGQTDILMMEIDDISPLRKIRVRSSGKGCRPDWNLQKIEMRNLATEEVTSFLLGDWLSRTHGDKKLIREMAAVVDDEPTIGLSTYTVTVRTSDAAGAGTDANVYIILFGEHGDSGTIYLKESNNGNKFERGRTDVFSFADMLSLGELVKLRIWHDNTGICAGWHLEYVEVRDEALGTTFKFHCDRWLAANEDDHQTLRELSCVNANRKATASAKDVLTFEITVVTGDSEGADTKENVWLVLEGKKKRSEEFLLENSSKARRFQRGATDKFEFESADVGDIMSLVLGHCPRKKSSSRSEATWHVQQIVLLILETGNKYIFPCDAQIELSSNREESGRSFECRRKIESFASRTGGLAPVKYEVLVVTGGEKGCGTDANVFIVVFGTRGDSGRRALKHKYRNLFERGKTSRFMLEALDLGELNKVRIEHDNSGLSAGWLLDRVEIINTSTLIRTIFFCNKWLDRKRGDRQTCRELFPIY
ncbi:lipoxygenase homology domain-containing protein 1 [Lampetra planeri]